MKSNEIREGFLRFFEERGHTRVHSSPVVPYEDPTLLFTNAGMNPFKDIFLGKEKRDYVRAASAQKCIRVSGKHNDLDDVGKDTYHHTFFEMLGNWSFGDYFKREAIGWAWELLTQVWGLPRERLWATVFAGDPEEGLEPDEEAARLWPEITGIPSERVLRFGKKDNFWEMGDTGPCGPCSEIHLDLGEGFGCGRPDCMPNCPHCERAHLLRYVELWNLVFIQFNRDEEGHLSELPARHVDTGMGFERICAVLQGVTSNYDTDLFMPIIEGIEEITGKSYRTSDQTPFQVIADHIRTLSFAIVDGAMPSNEGRGYVLRRILRRAARFGRTLDMHEPFLYRLVPKVVDVMGEAYPELVEKAGHASLVIKGEEASFGKTLDRGIELFEGMAKSLMKRGATTIEGREAFRLYDTYGFPLDLTQLMAEEKGLSVDVDGFHIEMERQRERARRMAKFGMRFPEEGEWTEVSEGPSSEFLGYTMLSVSAVIRRVRSTDNGLEVVLDRTPFYAEAGGQVGDTGRIVGDGFEVEVTDTVRIGRDIVHRGRIVSGSLEDLPAEVTAHVDAVRRDAIKRNHTATHLLHRALRTILGDHIHQSGSLVAPDRLRFDFTHFATIGDRDLEAVGHMVNEKIRENIPLSVFEKPLKEAQAMGATAIFGEKYGDIVRVVQIGAFSMELCGGTHVEATGEIGFFRLVSESSVASGVRRIEALTGEGAERASQEERRILTEVGAMLSASLEEIPDRIKRLLTQNRDLEKEVARLQRRRAGSEMDDLIQHAEEIEGVRVVASAVQARDGDALLGMADSLRERLRSGVGVLGTVLGGKAVLVAVVTDDLIQDRGLKAGNIVKDVAKIVGGGGGGRPHLAQAGGRHPEKLDEALGTVRDIVQRHLR